MQGLSNPLKTQQTPNNRTKTNASPWASIVTLEGNKQRPTKQSLQRGVCPLFTTGYHPSLLTASECFCATSLSCCAILLSIRVRTLMSCADPDPGHPRPTPSDGFESDPIHPNECQPSRASARQTHSRGNDIKGEGKWLESY